MLRFTFGLLTAGLLWWLLGDLLRPTPADAAPPAASDAAITAADASKSDAPAAAPAVLRRQSPLPASSTTEGGERSLSGEPRQPGGRGPEVAGDAAEPDAADAFLRTGGNAFLRSAEGRSDARRWVAEAAKQRPTEAVTSLTRLLEACMRGAIDKSDAEATAVVDEAYAVLQQALNRSLFDPANLTKARTYEVQPGEVLNRIAARVRREYDLKIEDMTLALFNRISNPRSLRAGQVLKIPVEPIKTVIEKRSFLMAVYLGDVIFRLYWIGHGKDDCTPETTFTIGVKQEKPDWYVEGRRIPYGHPDNLLGDYFVRFDHESYTGFGAHGTSDPSSLRTMASAGCIRMADADIKDFFQIIPRETMVEVRASN